MIASKLRTYLLTKEREGAEMADHPLKVKIDQFIQRTLNAVALGDGS